MGLVHAAAGVEQPGEEGALAQLGDGDIDFTGRVASFLVRVTLRRVERSSMGLCLMAPMAAAASGSRRTLLIRLWAAELL